MEHERKQKKQCKIGDAATKSLLLTKLEPSCCLHSPHCELNEHIPTRLLGPFVVAFTINVTRVTRQLERRV